MFLKVRHFEADVGEFQYLNYVLNLYYYYYYY